ncbi:hypothetical protein ACWDZ8_39275 [Streptomyces sp. NPDC003233]
MAGVAQHPHPGPQQQAAFLPYGSYGAHRIFTALAAEALRGL